MSTVSNRTSTNDYKRIAEINTAYETSLRNHQLIQEKLSVMLTEMIVKEITQENNTNVDNIVIHTVCDYHTDSYNQKLEGCKGHNKRYEIFDAKNTLGETMKISVMSPAHHHVRRLTALHTEPVMELRSNHQTWKPAHFPVIH